MNRLHWSHFIDADEFFCRPHMKQLPRFFGGLPAMPSPSSSTVSRWYFSRNAETSLGSEGIWDLKTRCSFIRLNDRFFKKSILRCGSTDGVLMVYITQELMPAMFIRIWNTARGHRLVTCETEYEAHILSRVHATLCHIIVQDNLWFFRQKFGWSFMFIFLHCSQQGCFLFQQIMQEWDVCVSITLIYSQKLELKK